MTSAGRPCLACGHPERGELDRRLLAGEALRKLSTDYGMSPPSLIRHRDLHLSRNLASAAMRERQDAEDRHGDDLLSEVRKQHQIAQAILRKAYNEGDHRGALAAVQQSLKAIELMGKMLGSVPVAQVNVLVSMEWKTVQVALLGALEQHPEAKRAVLTALEKLE